MRVGVIIRSYRLTEFLERVIKNYSWVDKIIIMNFPFGNYETTDNTEEIVNSLGLNNINLIKGNAPITQSEVFELAQKEVLDCDVVFISDADEFLLQSDQCRIANDLMWNKDLWKAEVMVIDYAKNDGTLAYTQRTHMPVVAFKPPTVFSGTRHCGGDGRKYGDINLHHFGYCIKDYEWKRANLWYSTDSADEIKLGLAHEAVPPKELVDALAS